MAQLKSLPLTVSCFSKIQIGLTFLTLAHPGSPGQRAVKRVRARVCVQGFRDWSRGGGSNLKVGGYVASAEREPIRGSGGGAPSGVQRQSPWSEGQGSRGGESPP